METRLHPLLRTGPAHEARNPLGKKDSAGVYPAEPVVALAVEPSGLVTLQPSACCGIIQNNWDAVSRPSPLMQ